MKSTNIYAIHGYTSSSHAEWFPWLKEQFKNSPVKMDIPNMPDSGDPHLETWLKHLRKNVLDIDENTIFIGHSLGCVTVLRYILEKNIKIKGAILVSGFINENPMDEQTEGLQEFVDGSLDMAVIKSLISSRIVITATDDDIVPTEATQKLAKVLDANLIILSSGKHFIARDGYTDFPILLNEIQKLIND
ncbi:alpha/beta hydrolase [Clostridium estertheticum]|uniref:Alpha/beta hydrolase n=1 Tax=Clostridium estertheticum TaxID=238834 RepID=A0AA47EK45_9CLOT|nr:alpha/beta hydrolase [Clostridium estertheticum]MBU3153649.1 alpha/beta hydrolase [Clostridium estertheticum]MBU3199002.1 alpha/beta hydrolase [Clostridium estertheticum]WAG61560.1 alpha/beta hydrolase [Clostridium estertheticum]WAG64310.1 alpha/beta hydrolase [Clostridium estertheticum]